MAGHLLLDLIAVEARPGRALLPFHIIAGSIAIISGFVALFTAKGARTHRVSGMIFVVSMLSMASTGAWIAFVRDSIGSVLGGLTSFYLVTTGLRTVRKRYDGRHWFDAASLVLGIVIFTLSLRFVIAALNSPTGTVGGLPPAPGYMFITFATFGVIGDIRVMMNRGIRGSHRIARHLWRMSIAMFIATSSFFLGQAKVMPRAMRIYPLLAIPVLVVLVMMVYWLVRVLWLKRRARRPSALTLAIETR